MKKGFTISEFLISLALLTIASIVVFAIIADTTNLSMRINKAINETHIAENALNLRLIGATTPDASVITINSTLTILDKDKNKIYDFTSNLYKVIKIRGEETNVPLFIYEP